MIRTSKHSLHFANKIKREEILSILDSYRALVQEIIDFIWNNGYESFSISKLKLNCPTFINSKFLKNFKSSFTERLKQAAGKQALAMISSATEKRRKQLWQLKENQKLKIETKYLQRAIDIYPLVKPNSSNINMELDSRFIDFQLNGKNNFIGFIKLSSIFSETSIKIPIVKSKVFDKWSGLGELKNSIRISEKNINLFFNINPVTKKEVGNIVGCDQGIKDIIHLSDNQVPKKYQDKFTLTDVQNILARKKKGSKGFKRAQEFRKNLINWSINSLDFSNIKELRIEKLFQLGKGKTKSRFLSHWTYSLINNKLKRLSEEKGFFFVEVSNEFRSQRCSNCGWVCKANRKGKTFCCKKCLIVFDADLNAATNLSLDLYKVPYWVRLKRVNQKGFYWNQEGLFSECYELIVHNAKKE